MLPNGSRGAPSVDRHEHRKSLREVQPMAKKARGPIQAVHGTGTATKCACVLQNARRGPESACSALHELRYTRPERTARLRGEQIVPLTA